MDQIKPTTPVTHDALDRALHAAMARVTHGLSPDATIGAWADWLGHLAAAPGRQMDLAERAGRNAMAVWLDTLHNDPAHDAPFHPAATDHRFTHADWAKAPFRFWQQSYLAAQDWWAEAARDLPGTQPRNADRVAFMLRQMLDMLSPSNIAALNPEVLTALRDSNGATLIDGIRLLLADMAQTASGTPAPLPNGHTVGGDIACTPGQVVFRNELFELIQYAPQTGETHPEPILIVPAWIMKYYILDLSPHNSLINYLVSQGFTVFAMSWVNPGPEMRDTSLDDYRQHGVMTAIDTLSEITGNESIHACGYCLGGTILSIAAATMARDGDTRLASVTLLAAQTDFTEAGELLLFLDETQLAFLEDMMFEQGVLDGKQMADAFRAIRAEDMIWTRAVRRYLMGIEDTSADIASWNADTTRMPATMHSQYLRSLFLENRLSAGRFAVDGPNGSHVIALKDIDAPMFVVGTETDHIAPWHSVYKTKLFTDTDLHFCLVKGGHNGGIVSEPGHPHRHYRIGHRAAGAHYMDPDSWLAEHHAKDGSWWPEWAGWLHGLSSPAKPAPAMGSAAHPPICRAPGTYVKMR